MSRHSTYYDLFGVPPSATLREIREAYIQLMKRHHPDAGHSDAADAADIVATANRYYAVLKDSGKRAAYDGHLSQTTRVHQALIAGECARRKNHAPALLILAVGAGIAVFAGAAIGIVHTGGVAALDIKFETDANHRAMRTPVPMPGPEEVEQIVRRAISIPSARAATASRQCYANASAAASESAAQKCVIFDEAALYSAAVWRDDLLASTYFNPDLVQVRQSGALSSFDDDEGRLEQLRTTALRQVLREAQVENATPAAAASPSTG